MGPCSTKNKRREESSSTKLNELSQRDKVTVSRSEPSGNKYGIK
jgi:hypothetical protein